MTTSPTSPPATPAPDAADGPRPNRGGWSAAHSDDLYGTSRWSNGYFSIGDDGDLVCHPNGDPTQAGISLPRIVEEAEHRGFDLPMLLRFGGILEHRIEQIAEAFRRAIVDNDYGNEHLSVYPIKVNQQSHVIDVVRQTGDGLLCGLEAGSKPELMAVLALARNDTLILCNGFKDEEYIELATLGSKIGRNVVPVVEKPSELELILELAERHRTRPRLGVRVKLASKGSGRWSSSAGHGSKFGLTASETVDLLRDLQAAGKAEALELLHFHIGSQITDIRQLKAAVTEAARIFVELRRLGADRLHTLDVGGGLGVDYDGSQTRFESSMNYTLQEYANDVVFHIGNVVHEAGEPAPRIVTECGRAITAYHSVLLCNVVGRSSRIDRQIAPPELTSDAPQPLRDLTETLQHISSKTLVECYHDAQTGLDEALSLFRLGYLSLEQRSLAEDLFWTICARVSRIYRRNDQINEELDDLERLLTDTYFCNMSVFQSLPDSWAIRQLFPIQPIHRLDQEPERRAVLADVSCDSDGQVDRFIDLRDVQRWLPVHDLDDTPYVIGFFLVGAYQEILGDLHNLFGDTNALHISLDENDRVVFEEVIPADTVREVLEYVQFDVGDLSRKLRRDVEQAVRDGAVDARTSGRIVRYFESSLEGTTYLERQRTDD